MGAEVPQIPRRVLHYSPLGTEKKQAGQEAQFFFLLVISIPISQWDKSFIIDTPS